MKNQKGSQISAVERIGRELRSRAEKLADQKRTAQPGQEPGDSRSMIHELQVHQIELELQNQELLQAHFEAEKEALSNRESDLRLVMNAVPALIAHVDTDGCYRQVNENYARWFSRSPDETRGRHMRDLLGKNIAASLTANRPRRRLKRPGMNWNFGCRNERLSWKEPIST